MTAAASLTGLTLTGGWQVGRRLERRPPATGGCYSQSYVVSRNSEEAFLKALDFSSAMKAPDLTLALQRLTSAYLHEKGLLEACSSARLKHVVLALDSGEVDVPGHGDLSRVPYLILERADHDVRKHMETFDQIDTAWVLRSLHHVAVGLWELHLRQIYHQDTKPSNVLVFPGGSRKISDLGRATRAGYDAEHDDYPFAGDPVYAPPELLYGFLLADDRLRRMACDMYLLGSLAAFFFSGLGITKWLISQLDPSLYPAHWAGRYAEVLPSLRDAYDRSLEQIVDRIEGPFRERLLEILRELCDPDPILRGDPRARAINSNPYSLERYVSRFDLLARQAEFAYRRSLGQ